MYTIFKYVRDLIASNDEESEEFDDASSTAESEVQIEIPKITEEGIVKEAPKLQMDIKKIENLCNVYPDLFQPNERNISGIVKKATSVLLEVELEQRGQSVRIDLNENIEMECSHEIGDRVNVQCYVSMDERWNYSNDDTIQVFGIKPAYKRKNIKCAVTEILEDILVLENDSFISKRDLLKELPDIGVGDVLYVDLIENKRNKLKWRGINYIYLDSNSASELLAEKRERKVHLTRPIRLSPPAPVGRWYNYEAKLCEYAQQVYSQNNVEVLTKPSHTNNKRFRAVRIGPYDVPPDLRDTYLKQYENPREWRKNLEMKFKSLTEELTFENYKDRFDTLLWLEEIELFKNFRQYDCEHAKFTRDCNYLAITIKNLAERRPSLEVGDKVRAHIIEEIKANLDNSTNATVTACDDAPHLQCYEGYIVGIMCDKVLLRFDEAFQKAYDGSTYRLEFFFSRTTFRRKHYVSMRITMDFRHDFLFPNEVRLRAQPQIDLKYDEATGQMYTPTSSIKWYNDKLNQFQRRAVYNVLRGETDMMPYIIYGPPGTGKTITLIETILQLVANFPNAKLLVAAPSNSAANLLCTRLLEAKALHVGELVRLVSYKSIERDQIPKSILKYCATVDLGEESTFETEMLTRADGIQMNCSISTLARFTVTVGTCAVLGKYMELGFSSDHFSHVIIDEAGQCTEPDAMTVISMVSKRNGQVILAGDPKQLRAIVINKYAEMRGLATSFLERLLQTKPYLIDVFAYEDYNGFNPSLVTQLLPNYRALPSILRIYNYISYEMKLQAMIDENDSDEFRLLQKVKHIHFPSEKRSASHGSFFYAVRGENMRDRDSPSWYNPREANVVFQMTYKLYAAGLKPDNIGIIAPYAKQTRYIRNLFTEAKIKPPKIGSVEEFQGQERDVIILSIVRTARREFFNYDWRFKLGFIQSERRFNVAISRARALLIVLGDPQILKDDSVWGIYLNECRTNDSFYGNIE